MPNRIKTTLGWMTYIPPKFAFRCSSEDTSETIRGKLAELSERDREQPYPVICGDPKGWGFGV